MYFVYKITNLINGKIYIGSSTESLGYESRWNQHKRVSTNQNLPAYKYPLYCSIRKYGVNNFTYEVIEKNIETLEDRQQIEQYYIIYYNSIDKDYGYNQTLDTRCPLADERIKEKIATKLYSIDINTREEKYFDSICDAAKECHAERTCIHQCLNGSNKYWQVKDKIFRRLENGQIIECDVTIQERLEEYDRKNPVIDGERHNIPEWCEIYGISRTTYYNRINEGMDPITALTTKKKKQQRR